MFWPSCAFYLAHHRWAGLLPCLGQPTLWPLLWMFLRVCSRSVLPFHMPEVWHPTARFVVSVAIAVLFAGEFVRALATLCPAAPLPAFIPEWVLLGLLWLIPEAVYYAREDDAAPGEIKVPVPPRRDERLARLRFRLVPLAHRMTDGAIAASLKELGDEFVGQFVHLTFLRKVPALHRGLQAAVSFAYEYVGLVVYVPMYMLMIWWTSVPIFVTGLALDNLGKRFSWLLYPFSGACNVLGCTLPTGRQIARLVFTVYAYCSFAWRMVSLVLW